MPNFSISVYLTNGATATIRQGWNSGSDALRNLENELAKDKCSLNAQQEGAILVIKNPKDNVVGYFIDRIEQ